MKSPTKLLMLLLASALSAFLFGSDIQAQEGNCIPDWGADDTLHQTECCSGYSVPGSTECENPADYGTTWESCTHICAPAPEPPDDGT